MPVLAIRQPDLSDPATSLMQIRIGSSATISGHIVHREAEHIFYLQHAGEAIARQCGNRRGLDTTVAEAVWFSQASNGISSKDISGQLLAIGIAGCGRILIPDQSMHNLEIITIAFAAVFVVSGKSYGCYTLHRRRMRQQQCFAALQINCPACAALGHSPGKDKQGPPTFVHWASGASISSMTVTQLQAYGTLVPISGVDPITGRS